MTAQIVSLSAGAPARDGDPHLCLNYPTHRPDGTRDFWPAAPTPSDLNIAGIGRGLEVVAWCRRWGRTVAGGVIDEVLRQMIAAGRFGHMEQGFSWAIEQSLIGEPILLNDGFDAVLTRPHGRN